MELRNHTPYLMDRVVFLDKKGAEQLVVVLKATFSIDERTGLAPAEKPDPIRATEEFHGKPDASSIAFESELSPPKLATDVFLLGSARAPKKGTTVMDFRFRVGPLAKTARVFGDRVWDKILGAATISAPRPFEAVPLVWEKAYGGQDRTPEDPKHHGEEPRNPVGCGFRADHSRAPWVGAPLPNIEDPRQLMAKPGHKVVPTGFGPIGRHWIPRRNYTGTCDQKWMEERMPLLPEDFDERFHNAAPPELVSPGRIRGGETVEVVGCTPGGVLRFELPACAPMAEVRIGDHVQEFHLDCDTVAVDTNRMQLTLLWKGGVNVHRRIMKIKEISCRLGGKKA